MTVVHYVGQLGLLLHSGRKVDDSYDSVWANVTCSDCRKLHMSDDVPDWALGRPWQEVLAENMAYGADF